MSANELLKHLKALPARERKKFFRAVQELEVDEALEAPPVRGKKAEPRVEWPDVLERAKKIFGDRVLPNMVLLEREESPY